MDKRLVKNARSRMNRVGVTLLVYCGMVYFVAICLALVNMIAYLCGLLVRSEQLNYNAMMEYVVDRMATSGWPYILSIVIGVLIVLAWKGKDFWRREMFERNQPMTVGSFFRLLCVFMSMQLIFRFVSVGFELILNLMGYSAMTAMEMATTTGGSFSMYLYACILGPISEELLFRGLLLRTLKPCGKQTAILVSALVFGLFHGNIVQIPFAFGVGLVLAYVALEHSILWAMVLHVFNNMVLADLLGRLLNLLPETVGLVLGNGIFLLTGIGAAVILIRNRRPAAAYLRQNKPDRISVKALVTSPMLWIFAAVMLAICLYTVTPL